VLHDGRTIAITLLRAVGFLSRGDLTERPIHAGPELPTPSAQCEGERTYRYCVVPLDATRGVADAERAVREWLSPPVLARGDGRTRSFVSFVEPKTPLVLTALRAAPTGALVVRVSNPTPAMATNGLRFWRDVRTARAVDLREGQPDLGNTGLDVIRTAAPPDVVGSVATISLQPYEIGTWLVDLA
jgi:alpha-mannosidase